MAQDAQYPAWLDGALATDSWAVNSWGAEIQPPAGGTGSPNDVIFNKGLVGTPAIFTKNADYNFVESTD